MPRGGLPRSPPVITPPPALEQSTGDPPFQERIAQCTAGASTGASLRADRAVARGAEPEDLVRRPIGALGGMGRFVPKRANVVLKPSICVAYHTREYAATTNPSVVAAPTKMRFEADAK